FIMIESFTNPSDYGWKTSEIVAPAFSKINKDYISGVVITPVFGGKSINAEFELLTGLTNRFTPVESMPYREFVSKKIPAIPTLLKARGYETNVIQVVKMNGFGYKKIYDYLQVDNKISLHKNSGVKLDPSGKFAASEEISNKIIELTDQQDKSFIFAFSNSSHSPWKLEDYPDNSIDILNKNSYSGKERNHLIAYFNALNHADEIVSVLVEYYENSDENTLIMVVGDHQPAIQGYHQKTVKPAQYEKYTRQFYSVPAVIWNNYLEPEQKKFELSMNFLASYVLTKAGVDTVGFVKFNQMLMKKIKVLTLIIRQKKGHYLKEVPAEYKKMIDDYEILQYEILMSETINSNLY
ncbi:MAG: LTA synthase family protein, partial [Proteobacteria bacterium]|nr:LTA synthase family protein [Pseudomonadota bacterium]